MIKFPRVHVAESVVNRILNTRDELKAGRSPAPAPTPAPAPPVPDPTIPGAELDLELAQPPPANVPPLEQDPESDELAGAVAAGDDLIRA